MSIEITQKLEDPESARFTLQVTMELREWRRFDNQIGRMPPGVQNESPTWSISNAIQDLIRFANEKFVKEVEV